ncbi:hypothetical protein QVD17_39337 [Tagetes erecta]|uniref:Uncharacterized protein n=1 Tax=Tagetes erecta TaxID=13708 RepID=A0AAD8JQE4_TARER|nr:hypothetical protein QVD17_39337 [Tagetes erecta]
MAALNIRPRHQTSSKSFVICQLCEKPGPQDSTYYSLPQNQENRRPNSRWNNHSGRNGGGSGPWRGRGGRLRSHQFNRSVGWNTGQSWNNGGGGPSPMGRQLAHVFIYGGGVAAYQVLSNPNFLLNGYSNLEHGSGSHKGSTNSQHNPSLGFSSPQGPTSQFNGQSTSFQGVLGPCPLSSANSTNFLGFGTTG